MLKVNYEVLNSKVSNFNSLKTGEKYALSNKVFNMLSTADKRKIEDVLVKSTIKDLYDRAESLVLAKTNEGMILVPETLTRIMTLVFSSNDQDTTGSFFEVSTLAKKLSEDPLENLVIIGFFMDEDRMNIIQAYNLLSPEITGMLND